MGCRRATCQGSDEALGKPLTPDYNLSTLVRVLAFDQPLPAMADTLQIQLPVVHLHSPTAPAEMREALRDVGFFYVVS